MGKLCIAISDDAHDDAISWISEQSSLSSLIHLLELDRDITAQDIKSSSLLVEIRHNLL